jgi:outer membrane lipoprotein-sorting protein
MKKIIVLFAAALFAVPAMAQSVTELLAKVKEKYDKVNDYEASGNLKTNVLFIKAPVAKVKVYYKKPDKIKIKNENGVSFIPKGSVNINMSNILSLKNYDAVDGGTETIGGVKCKVVRIFPSDDNADITRATLYIDEAKLLVRKTAVSTRENGSYEILMSYGKYEAYGLPDKVEMTFNAKDYKLPKGITIDYDNGSSKDDKDKEKNKKGKVEITYTEYKINKGIDDSVFK